MLIIFHIVNKKLKEADERDKIIDYLKNKKKEVYDSLSQKDKNITDKILKIMEEDEKDSH